MPKNCNMKTIKYALFLIVFTIFQSCKAQKMLAPKLIVDNYNKGELELKTVAFGEETPIAIGKVKADGSIHFDWPELSLSKLSENKFLTTSIDYFTSAKYCKDPKAVVTNKEVILVENQYLYLYKYDQIVGCIIPSTQKGQEHNNRQLGSTLTWVYSEGTTSAMLNCHSTKAWEDLYSFEATTSYDLRFKKGWNLISNTLVDMESWDNGTDKGSLPKTVVIQSIDEVPSNIYWHLKYWANDELIELERALLTKAPITEEQYENWLPSSLGSLKRTAYEIGKKLERIPVTNNVNLLFESGTKKLDLIIVDCVGTKEAASGYTMQQDMESRDWHDKTETGYQSASEMDGIRVMMEYNETLFETNLSNNLNDRFFIKAQATNIEPEELWAHLKSLKLPSS